MSSLHYQLFDVHIQRAEADNTYPVAVSAGTALITRFRLPLSTEALENFLARSDNGETTIADLESFGQQLSQALFERESTLLLGRCLSGFDVVRLRLRIEAPELAIIPWEFMYGPEANGFFALSPQVLISRYLPLTQPGEIEPIKWPLQVLVVCATPTDLPTLDEAGTLARVHRALEPLGARVQVRVLTHTHTALLQSALRQPVHVLHFVGHGRRGTDANQGALALEQEDGTTQWLGASELAALLRERGVRLTYLDACETAGMSADTGRGIGVAETLMLQAGMPAVLAMRFRVTDQAAQTFANTFYAALVDGYSLDAAVAEGRKTLRVMIPDQPTWSWGAPVLYLSQSAEGLVSPPRTDLKRTRGQQLALGGVGGVLGLLLLATLLMLGPFARSSAPPRPTPNPKNLALIAADWPVTTTISALAVQAQTSGVSETLWIGTDFGSRYALYRLDSVRGAQKLAKPQYQFDTLSPILGIMPDCLGNLWLRLDGGQSFEPERDGTLVYRPATGRKDFLLNKVTQINWLSKNTMYASATRCLEGGAAEIWLGREGVHTLRYTGDYPTLTTTTFVAPDQDQLFQATKDLLDVRSVWYNDAAGRQAVWVASERTLKVVPITQAQAGMQSWGFSGLLWSLARDSDDLDAPMWLGGDGFIVPITQTMPGGEISLQAQAGHNGRAFTMVAGDSLVWLGERCAPGDLQCVALLAYNGQQFFKPDSALSSVFALARDQAGVVWIGTPQGLLAYVPDTQ